MSRAIRGSVARLLIAALLFMQFAVAAYACPNVGSLSEPRWAPTAVAPEQLGGNMERCTRLDPADPHRCLQHCQQGSQTTDSGAPIALPAAVLALLAVIPVDLSLAAVGPLDQPEFLARATAPPSCLRFCVLRT